MYNMDHTDQYKVLIVGDSRLRHIESHLNATSLNICFTVKMLPGARLTDIVLSAMASLSYTEVYHLVLLIGGINDLSKLVYLPSKHALPRFGNHDDLVNRTLESFRQSMSKIRAIMYPLFYLL